MRTRAKHVIAFGLAFVCLAAGPTPVLWNNVQNFEYVYRDLNQLASNEIDNRLVGQTPGAPSQDIYSTRNDSGGGTYVRSSTHFLHDVDLTPISVYNNGGTPQQTATLISPRHVLMAHHYFPANGTTFRFVTSAGVVVTRTLSNSTRIGSTDLRIGILDSDVPSTISFARVPKADARLLDGAPVFWVNQNFRLYVGDATLYSPGEINVNTSGNSLRSPFAGAAVAGDSSHPIAFVLDKQLVLISTLESGSPILGPELSAQYAAINTTMAALGTTYQLTPINVTALGSAGVLDARFTPTNGQIPTVDSNGKLNPVVIPPGFDTGTQPAGTVFAAPAYADGAGAFRALAIGHLPTTFRLGLQSATFSNADFGIGNFCPGLSDSVISYAAQIGTLTAPRTVTLPTHLTTCQHPIGSIIVIADESGSCSSTNTITVKSNLGTTSIDGGQIVLDTPYASCVVRYIGSGLYHQIAQFRSTINRHAVADANYTTTASDYIVAFTSLTASRTITLVATPPAGFQQIVKDESGSVGINIITIQPTSGTIDGAANKGIGSPYGALRFYYNGANWFTW